MSDPQHRRYIPRSKLPEGGEIPPRGTREAVLHLVRLANAVPSTDGTPLRDRLLWVARKLNAKLAAGERVSAAEMQAAAPFDGTAQAVAELAVASIGAYVTNQAIEPMLNERQRAFLALERYFVWCRGLWTSVASTREVVDAFDFDPETMPALEDMGEHSLGAMLHWLASISVVIEGWEELELIDATVDSLLLQGGSAKDEGSLRHRLQRFRNAVFHFQSRGTDDARFKDFWDDKVVRWAIPVETAFEDFFRRAWESQQALLEPWLYRGLEPRYDPEMEP